MVCREATTDLELRRAGERQDTDKPVRRKNE
jgi:hypothetical protein